MNFNEMHLVDKKEILFWMKNKNVLVLGLSLCELERIEETISKEDLEFWEDFFSSNNKTID